MSGHYLNKLPRKAMRALGGYPVQQGHYWLDREQQQPPVALAQQVFPHVESYIEKLKLAAKNNQAETDLAGLGFLKLLQFLRVVLLQDSVQLMKLWPNHVVFKHQLFKSNVYKDFALSHSAATIVAIDPTSLSLKLAMPMMTEVLESGYRSVEGRLNRLEQQVAKFVTCEELMIDLKSSCD